MIGNFVSAVSWPKWMIEISARFLKISQEYVSGMNLSYFIEILSNDLWYFIQQAIYRNINHFDKLWTVPKHWFLNLLILK